jgi:hypothetical protein
MAFIGAKPTNVPLTSADLEDSIITSAKIVDGTISSSDIDLTDNYDFTGTVTGAGGITEADQWRMNADLSITTLATETLISANWERNTNSGFSKIGTGMTESSGTFTFPSTGIYQITHFFSFYSPTGGSEFNRVSLHTTINNSAYTNQTHNFTATSTTPKRASATSSFLFDVTDTTNCKARFYYYVQGNVTLLGTNNKNEFHVNFLRVGDT